MANSILNFHFDYLHPSLNYPPKNATTATPSSDTRDFKQWLETKLFPSPVPSVVACTGIENSLSRASSADSRTLEPQFSKPQGTAQSTPVQPSNHLNTSPPPSSPHSLPSPPHTNGVLSHAGDDGSSDEDFSPTLGNNRAVDCSLSSTQEENEANKDCQSKSEAKIERKRLKREEKEKRREERRKKKMLQRQQDQEEVSEGPDFEEDEDGNCVIRITPKPVLPIKLKIKPIMRPEQSDHYEQPNPPSYPMMMHPKKKVAHMELENIDHLGSNPLNGTQDYQPAVSPPPAVSSTTGSDLNCLDGHAAEPLTLPPHLSSPLPGGSLVLHCLLWCINS